MASKEYHKTYYQQNKDRIRSQHKERYQNKKKEHLEYCAKYRELNYERDILIRCRTNARVNNLPFNLELSDISIPTFCSYLGVPLTRIQGRGRVSTNASIDRIIPELGYVKGNVEIISELANRMKQNATKEQLIKFAKSVLERVDG